MKETAMNTPAAVPHYPKSSAYQRIATEEAFAPPELLAMYRKIIEKGNVDPGFKGLMGFYMTSPSDRAQHIMRCLTDMDDLRIEHMDACGIDKQVLALTSPGVQVMDKETAVSFARIANDYLADAIRRHPTRYVGMLAVSPQDPAAAAKEIGAGAIDPGRRRSAEDGAHARRLAADFRSTGRLRGPLALYLAILSCQV